MLRVLGSLITSHLATVLWWPSGMARGFAALIVAIKAAGSIFCGYLTRLSPRPQQGWDKLCAMQIKYLSNSSARAPSLLRKSVAFVATIALIGLGLMFSAVLLALILSIGAVAFAYLWWKTRELRKLMQNSPARSMSMGEQIVEGEVIKGEVIEGEVIRVVETQDGR